MSPDLELVHTRQDESFRAWVHDYPHTVAKWHFHPEYEVHVITASTGKFFVGDFIGDFAPGKAADFVYVRPREGSVLDAAVRHAADPSDALAAVFMLAGPESIREVRVEGDIVFARGD